MVDYRKGIWMGKCPCCEEIVQLIDIGKGDFTQCALCGLEFRPNERKPSEE